jgi:hypothetical protein
MEKSNGLDRLRGMYPLFDFSMRVENGRYMVTATLSESSSFYFQLNASGRVPHEALQSLDKDHMEKSISTTLMKRYPDLYIYTFSDKNDIEITAWVKRENQSREAIGSILLIDPNIINTLNEWQDQAQKAKQDGMFFCSGHQRAEPKTDWGYFHFAGQYCKQYGNENPESIRSASTETYN